MDRQTVERASDRERVGGTPRSRTATRWWGLGILVALAPVLVVVSLAVAGPTAQLPVAVAIASPTASAPTRTDRPAPAPWGTARPAASPSASPTIAWTEPFNSVSHGYAIRYPLGWKSSQADGTTTSRHIRSDGSPVPPKFSIIRRTKDDLSLTEVADATFAPRSQAGWCRGGPFGRTGMPASPETFHDSVIDGHPALVRSECSFVDAVIDAGGDVLVIVLRSANRMPTGDASQFRHFMDTLEIGTLFSLYPAPAQPEGAAGHGHPDTGVGLDKSRSSPTVTAFPSDTHQAGRRDNGIDPMDRMRSRAPRSTRHHPFLDFRLPVGRRKEEQDPATDRLRNAPPPQ